MLGFLVSGHGLAVGYPSTGIHWSLPISFCFTKKLTPVTSLAVGGHGGLPSETTGRRHGHIALQPPRKLHVGQLPTRAACGILRKF